MNNMPESFKKSNVNTQQFLVLDLPTDNSKYVSPYRFSYEAIQSYNISNRYTNCPQERISETAGALTDPFLSNVNYLWLLKPADMNRGNGVHVFNTIDELEVLLKSYYSGWVQKDFESPCKAKPVQPMMVESTPVPEDSPQEPLEEPSQDPPQ